MNRLKRYLPTKLLRILYNYLVLPHLHYAILSWGSRLSRLSNLQKRVIRVVSYSKCNAHTEPLFKSLNVLQLEDMLLKLYYMLCHVNLPAYATDLFTRVVPGTTHDYDLRPSGILKMPTTHTCVAERCIRFIFPKIINDTDPSVTDKVYTHSFQGFTNYVKVAKINSYATRCLIANCYICQHPWRTNESNAYAQRKLNPQWVFMFLWRCHGDVASLCFLRLYVVYAVYRIFKVYLRH